MARIMLPLLLLSTLQFSSTLVASASEAAGASAELAAAAAAATTAAAAATVPTQQGNTSVSAAAAAAADAAAAVEASYEGYGKAHFVEGYKMDKPPKTPKGGFFQSAFTTCPDPYNTFSLVTRLQVCQDTSGFITGFRYFNWHLTKHFDPVIVCDMTSSAEKCVDIDLFDPKYKWSAYKAITNVRVVKAKDEFRDWKVVYIAFGFSDGGGYEIGTFNPDFPGLKIDQWYQEPKLGKLCGLNGFASFEAICDKKTGYLNYVKPCYTCRAKPRAPKMPKGWVKKDPCIDEGSCGAADQKGDGRYMPAAALSTDDEDA